eukprot:TRINITY_DN3129_c1_g1_i1.p1 TRINITY_DN3129_c1_g1~~TRINITY_DN3129_c1_g1_i1.p1  ORF type:complete len:1111 (+),score=331.21 TRINITY_DN3129_c1_g1_i1:124-3456(+)
MSESDGSPAPNFRTAEGARRGLTARYLFRKSLVAAANRKEAAAEEDQRQDDEGEPQQAQPASPAAGDNPGHNETVLSAEALIASLRRDVSRTRQYKACWLYVIFLMLWTALVFIDRIDESTSPFFYRNLGNLRIAHAAPEGTLDGEGLSSFYEISSLDGFWDWLNEAMIVMWPRGTCKGGPLDPSRLADNMTWAGAASHERQDPSALAGPLSFIVLRQFRVELEDCADPELTALPAGLGKILKRDTSSGDGPARCYPPFGRETASVAQHNGTENATAPHCAYCRCQEKYCERCLRCLPEMCCNSTLGVLAKAEWPCGIETTLGNCTADPFVDIFSPDTNSTPTCQTSPIPPYYSNARTTPFMARVVDSVPFHGMVEAYTEPSMAYTQMIDLNQSLTHGLLTTCALRRASWIDEGTRAVLVEFVTYSQAADMFTFTSLSVERLASGNWVTHARSVPFRYLSLSASSNKGWMAFLFALDLFSFLYILGDFVWFVYLAKADRDMRDESDFAQVGLWGLLSCGMFAVFVSTFYYRFFLWYRGWGVDEDWWDAAAEWKLAPDYCTHYENGASMPIDECAQAKFMWYQLSHYAYTYGSCAVLMSLATILAYLRLFAFAQYTERLNILTETVKMAVGDLLGVLVLASIVVFGFGISAHMLFADRVESFRHLTISLGTLLRVLVSGECPMFDDMEAQHRVEARLLVLFFFMIAWLVLLNMVLAIVNGSFAAVQEASAEPVDWSLPKLHADVMDFVCPGRSFRCCASNGRGKDSDDDEEIPGEPETPGENWEVQPPLDKDDQYIQNRIKAADLLRRWRPEALHERQRVTRKVFEQLVCKEGKVPLPKHAITRIFNNAKREVSASDHCNMKGERWAQGVSAILGKSTKVQTHIEEVASFTMKIPAVARDIDEINADMLEVVRLHGTKGVSNAAGDELNGKASMQFDRNLQHLQDRAEKLCVIRETVQEEAEKMQSTMDEAQCKITDLLNATRAMKPGLKRLGRQMKQCEEMIVQELRRGTMLAPEEEPGSFQEMWQAEGKAVQPGVGGLIDSVQPHRWLKQEKPEPKTPAGPKTTPRTPASARTGAMTPATADRVATWLQSTPRSAVRPSSPGAPASGLR